MSRKPEVLPLVCDICHQQAEQLLEYSDISDALHRRTWACEDCCDGALDLMNGEDSPHIEQVWTHAEDGPVQRNCYLLLMRMFRNDD